MEIERVLLERHQIIFPNPSLLAGVGFGNGGLAPILFEFQEPSS
jgi:hypothetical protein